MGFNDSCDAVFKARAATFAELTWMILISAWEFKSLRRSMFRLNPDDDSKFSFFPVVYIPTLNTKFFKHKGISWEWALSVAFLILFVVGVELWKFIKRRFHLLEDKPVNRGAFHQGSEEEGHRFGRSLTMSSFKTWASLGRSRSRSRTNDSLSRPSSRKPTE